MHAMTISRTAHGLAVAVIFWLFQFPAIACAESGLAKYLSVEYLNADELQVYSTSIAVSSLQGWSFSFSAGSEHEDNAVQSVSADSWSADLVYDWGDHWSVGLGFDNWDGERSVTQKTLTATLGFSVSNWRLDASFRQRELRIAGRALNGNTRLLSETFEGGELKYQYFFNDNFSASLGYTSYQENPGAVFQVLQNRPALANRLSNHSFGLLAGQARRALDLTLNLQWQDWYLSIRVDTADNYFDEATSKGLSLYVEKSVTPGLALGTEVGVQNSDDADSVTYFSTGAHFSW